jgi:Undecaprenyl-phosphate glucose phosphotransferase
MDDVDDLSQIAARRFVAMDPVEGAVATPAPRGPMRPAVLATSRRRLHGRTMTRRFRLIDAAILAALLPLSLVSDGGASVLDIPLRQALGPVIGATLVALGLKAAKTYDFSARESLMRHGARVGLVVMVCGSSAVWTALAAGAGTSGALWWLLLALGMISAAHAAEWRIVRHWRGSGLLTPNVVVVGATSNARRLIEAALTAGDAAVIGVFDDRMSRIPRDIHGVPVLGDTRSLLTHKLLPFIDHIIITVTPSARGRVREIIDRLKYLPNAVTLFIDVEGVEAQRKTLSRLSAAPLAQVSGIQGEDVEPVVKRGQDLVIGALALILAAPIMLFIALAIRLEGQGPILFRQRRFGFNNETIDVWKFRSMRLNGHDPSGSLQVRQDDARVTAVGRFIRRLSLDELPQLFNVLAGEMSLVGPRPHAVTMKASGHDAARLVAEYAWRHRVKPGLTGWAQINGSIGPIDTPELVRRRVALDVEYIERHSVWLDLYILAMTPLALIRARRIVR